MQHSTAPIHIELPFMPGSSVNVYLFRTPEPVLIDAGHDAPDCWQALQAALAEQHLTPSDLRRVIITHPHVDHYGLAAKIAQAGSAEISIAAPGLPWLSDFPAQMQRRLEFYREDFIPYSALPPAVGQRYLGWMARMIEAWQPLAPQQISAIPLAAPLSLGGCDWQVLHTPGHDGNQICFYQADTGQLISADALMIPTATPVGDAPPLGQLRAPALPEMMRSLERLARLEVETVYPGHGTPFGNHRAVIQAQIRRIHERKEEALRSIQDGADTLAAVFERLYASRTAEIGMTGVWMAMGYLDLLEAEGRVSLAIKDGLWRYCQRFT